MRAITYNFLAATSLLWSYVVGCNDVKGEIMVEIKKMEKQDIPRLRELCFSEGEDTSELQYALQLISGTGKLENAYIAEQNEEMIGFVYGTVSGLIIHPRYLFVAPSHRRKGIGEILMRTLEKMSRCTSSIIVNNDMLHRYYLKQGYVYDDDLSIGRKVLDN